jgi:quinol monooxygenase YgiN
MIHVVATIELKPGTREAFLEEFRNVVPAVLAEHGAIEYGAAVDLSTKIERQVPLRDDVVTIIEKWEDVPSLKAHLVAPHMLAYRECIKDYVQGAQLQILQPA